MHTHDWRYYRDRRPLTDLGHVGNFKRFLWDPERRAFLDRTGQEWVDVGVFYLCFFGLLFSIASLQMWVTYKCVTVYDRPFFDYSRGSVRIQRSLSHGPGIDMKPNIIPNANPPLILLDDLKNNQRLKDYADAADEVLEEYRVDKSKYEVNCNDRRMRDENAMTPCFFNIQLLGECSKTPYGYTTKPQPCVYIKLNKRIAWLPNFYNQASPLPPNMPKWLKTVIRYSDKLHVWLSCEGITKDDNERIGEIDYLPTSGFPVQYFPFNGQSDYLAPMVALHFKNLTVNQLVSIECKTWASNIDNEYSYNLNFQIMIADRQTETDDNTKS